MIKLIVCIAAVVVVGLMGLTVFAVRHWKRSAASIAEQRRRIRSTRVGG